MNTFIFGDISEFALEVSNVTHDGKWLFGNVLMMVKGKPVGDQTQLVALNTCYPHIDKFLANWEHNLFPEYSHLQIHELFYLLYLKMFDSSKKNSSDYLSLSRYRGLCHLDDLLGAALWDSFRAMAVRIKTSEVILIWEDLDNELISSASVSEETFYSAFRQYRDFIQDELESGKKEK